MDFNLFISCVSDEFRVYRNPLRNQLNQLGTHTIIQEELNQTGHKTLEKLNSYVQNSSAVVHLVGHMSGALVDHYEVKDLLLSEPDWEGHIPDCLQPLIDGIEQATYTQWEAYLARLNRVELFVIEAHSKAERGDNYQRIEKQINSQQKHLERLKLLKAFPNIEKFGNYKELGFLLLTSDLQRFRTQQSSGL